MWQRASIFSLPIADVISWHRFLLCSCLLILSVFSLYVCVHISCALVFVTHLRVQASWMSALEVVSLILGKAPSWGGACYKVFRFKLLGNPCPGPPKKLSQALVVALLIPTLGLQR